MDLRADWNDCRLAVLDTETTGLNPEKDRIIEVGIAIYLRGEVVEEYQTLVDPQCEIPEEVVRITGIQPSELNGAPTFDAIVDDVYARISDHVVVAYNLAFDRRFIERELERCGRSWPDVPTIDPLVFVRELHRDQGSKRLEAVAARLGIPHPDAHRALNDAMVAAQVLFALAPQLPPGLHDLITLQQQWAIKQEQEMSGWRSRQSSDFQVNVGGGVALVDAEGMMSLGPAFVYGSESDPLRALFSLLSKLDALRPAPYSEHRTQRVSGAMADPKDFDSNDDDDLRDDGIFSKTLENFFIPELIKKAVVSAVKSILQSEETMRKIAAAVIPKDAVNYLFSQLDNSKNEILRIFARELHQFLEQINLGTELQKILTSVSFEIKTEIRFIPNDESVLQPKVKAKVRPKRADRNSSSDESDDD